MASRRLHNYLRTHRKRLGLSQAEVAYLLGTESGAKVCRYEQFTRAPGLETALAYEAIFKKPVCELFAGLYQKIEQKVRRRAVVLERRITRRPTNRQGEQKCQVLKRVAARSRKTNDPA